MSRLNLCLGSSVATITAMDADSGDFGKITYLLDRLSSQVIVYCSMTFRLNSRFVQEFKLQACLFFRVNSQSIQIAEC